MARKKQKQQPKQKPMDAARRALLQAAFGPVPDADSMSDEEFLEALKDRIEKASLTHRERDILKLRYGLGDGYTYTLEEAARIFKVTRERIRQIEAKAVRKLQHPVRARDLAGFLEYPSGHGEAP